MLIIRFFTKIKPFSILKNKATGSISHSALGRESIEHKVARLIGIVHVRAPMSGKYKVRNGMVKDARKDRDGRLSKG